jgi:hypothetical protein
MKLSSSYCLGFGTNVLKAWISFLAVMRLQVCQLPEIRLSLTLTSDNNVSGRRAIRCSANWRYSRAEASNQSSTVSIVS